MKMFWIYIRALGLVLGRRWKKAMENKKNVMIVWGILAAFLLCFGVGSLVHTLKAMHAVHVNAQISVAEVMPEEQSSSEKGEHQMMQEQQMKEAEGTDETPVQVQSLVEESVPLTMEPIDEATFQQEDWLPITTAGCSVSSVLRSESGKSYEAVNLLDGDVTTNWQEGEDGDGIGTTLEFTFAEKSEIIGFLIVNGNGISKEKYEADSRMKEMTLSLNDQEVSYALEDVFGEQYVIFDEAVSCEQISIRIDSVYEGTKYDDTCISDIFFYTVNP